MFKEFWEKKKLSIQFTGFITGLGALFLNIPVPAQDQAKIFLSNVQVFWLALFTICLISLSIDFIVFLFFYEKTVLSKYAIPTTGIFSLSLAAILLWVVVNLLGYISVLYQAPFSKLLEMVLPASAVYPCILLLIYVEKNKEKLSIFTQIIINSFVMAAFISIPGIYIQQAIVKHFSYYWIYVVFPISFIILSVLLIGLAKTKKKKLFN